MRSELLTGRAVWRAITALAKQRAGHAAVAYCGTGSRKLLPLKRGSVLVVDASDGVVKAGLTDPRELKKFVRAGVRVHSAGTLHAKVFVFGDTAIVGSANASKSSAKRLIEAAFRTDGRAVAAATRRFVEGLVGEELDLRTLESLEKIYRSPRHPAAAPSRRKQPRAKASVEGAVPVNRPLWAMRTEVHDWDALTNTQADTVRPSARKKIDRRHEELSEFRWQGYPVDALRVRDEVVEVFDDGVKTRLLAPARVVKIKRYRRPGRTRREMIVFLARSKKSRAVGEKRARKRLGRGSWLVGLKFVRRIREPEAAHATRRLWRMT